MEHKPQNIGEFFNTQLSAMDFSMPDDSWQAIEPYLPKKEKKRRFIIWFWLGGLLFIVGLGIYSWNRHLTYSTKQKNIHRATSMQKRAKNALEHVNENSSDTILEKKASSPLKANIVRIDFQKNTHKKLNTKTKAYNRSQSETAEYPLSVIDSNANKVEPQPTINTTQNINPASITNSDGTLLREEIDSLCWDSGEKKKNGRKEKKQPETASDEQEAKGKYTFWIMPYAGPMLLKDTGTDQILVNQDTNQKVSEITVTYGIQFRWMMNENWGLQLGIGKMQARQRFSFTNQNLLFNFDHIESSLNQNDLNNQFAGMESIQLQRDVTYWEVPMEAYYLWSQNKWNMAVSAGLSYLVQTQNSLSSTNASGQSFYIGNVFTDTRNSMSANAKVHVQYVWKKNWRLEIVPAFQYHFLTNVEQTRAMNYWFSIRSGITYQLPF
jgi:hypothetical protein